MTDKPYTEEDVRSAAAVLCDRRVDWYHHDRTDDWPCSGCVDDATAALDALAAAGRLLPVPVEHRERLVVNVAADPLLHAHEVGGPYADCPDCVAKAAATRPGESV